MKIFIIILISFLFASCGESCRREQVSVRHEDPVPMCRVFYFQRPEHLIKMADESCDIPRPDYIKVYTVINGQLVKHVGTQWDVDLALVNKALDKERPNLLMLFSSNRVW